MNPKAYWREMASPDFKDCSDWIAVLPLAAIEQHGPHLPVGVDAFIAEGMVARAAMARPNTLPFTFLPLIEVAKSNEHIRFGGTLSLDWEQAIKSWIQIGQSVARTGVRKFVMITSHGGNVAPMEIVARELRESLDMLAVTTSWGRLGDWQQVYDLGDGPLIDIHAGMTETAPMLVHRPDLVAMEKAENFASAQSDLAARYKYLGYHSSPAHIAWLADDLNPAGALGDASAANAEVGKRDIDAALAGFLTLMEEVHDMPPPKRTRNV